MSHVSKFKKKKDKKKKKKKKVKRQKAKGKRKEERVVRSVSEGEERERERGKRIFSLLSKIYRNRTVGFRRRKKTKSVHASRAMREYQNLGVLSNSTR